jgi:hypothetical protein
MKHINKLALFLSLILAANLGQAMIVEEALQTKFRELCKNMPKPVKTLTGRYEIKDNTLRIPAELLHRRLDNVAIDLLTKHDLNDPNYGIVDTYEGWDLSFHSIFFFAAHMAQHFGDGEIFKYDPSRVSSLHGFKRSLDPFLFSHYGKIITLYSMLDNILKNADALHAKNESNVLFQKNYVLLKDQLESDQVKYLGNHFASHLENCFAPLYGLDAETAIHILIEGADNGKIDKDWLLGYVDQLIKTKQSFGDKKD